MRNWSEVGVISLPDWVKNSQRELQACNYPDSASRMGVVLEAARRNVQQSGGAPLAAGVFLESGTLLSLGVDAPGIGGHEMTNALFVASNMLGSTELRLSNTWELYSLAPPCAVCLGNIYSERPRRFVCAVTHAELLAELSLPDTLMPGPDWIDVLRDRGIIVEAAVRCEEGRRILSRE